jgi:putative ABC transport system ATP-binding protein
MSGALLELRQVQRIHATGEQLCAGPPQAQLLPPRGAGAVCGDRGSTYKGRVHALAGIDLRVQAGEGLAITGPSGCGKSSLLNVLGLLDRPSAGEYRFAGQDVQALAPRALARLRGQGIGFVFQQFHLLPHLTALDNVALPLRYGSLGAAEAARQAGEALAAVGLAERALHRPAQLSGGQCQRVAIAQALVARPRVLLADEPTGALDSANGEHVLDLMLALHRERGMTLIVVTHDAAIARRLPRCVRLRDGRVQGDEQCGVAREAVHG